MKNIYNYLINKSSTGKFLFLILSMTAPLSSCEDFVEIGPPKTEITPNTVFSSDATAQSAIKGIYSMMISNQSFTKGDLERYTGLSSDELNNFSSNSEQLQFAQTQLVNTNSLVYRSFWGQAYSYIANANAVLEGLNSSTEVSADVKNQLMGEALFIRAFCHFYLVNLFGDIPYITTTDYQVTSVMTRASIQQVYESISKDLVEAKPLLNVDYLFTANQRIQPNRSTAAALLARVYLYLEEWSKAEEQSSEVISNQDLYKLETNLANVFLSGSKEAIWQLKPVVPGTNTPQGQFFILTTAPSKSLGGVALSNSFLSSFEPNDTRYTQWVKSFVDQSGTYYYAFKYKQAYNTVVTEFPIMFRLAEQYLIRAEARAQLNKLDQAKSDLDAIRLRAGLSESTASDKSSMLDAIQRERRIELFTEGGHRWLDLKRKGQADAILGSLKPLWESTDQLYPIPNAERMLNSNLSQNQGY